MTDTKRWALASIKSTDSDAEPNGSFEVVLSTDALDRDGEIIDKGAFEPLPDHITFDIDHGMSVATTVGSGVPSYDDEGRLLVKGTYSSRPLAQEVRTLVNEGHIRTTSVAFMEAKRSKGEDGSPHITSAELLNGAFVPIPSNRTATVLSSKAYRDRAAVPAAGRRWDPAQRHHKAAALLGSRTANELRSALDTAIRGLHEDVESDVWVWVRDFSDSWVVYDVSGPDTYKTWQENYTLADDTLALAGDPVEVRATISYTPVEQVREAPTNAAPAKGAANSSASVARARAAAAEAMAAIAAAPQTARKA